MFISNCFLLSLAIWIVLLTTASYPQKEAQPEFAKYYGVYFKVFPWTIVDDPGWLSAVIDEWGATGVEIEIVWRVIEPERSNLPDKPAYNWKQLDQALDILLERNVDLFFKVRLGSLLPDWVDFDSNSLAAADGQVHRGLFEKGDFHIGFDGNHIWKGKAPLSNNNSNRYFNLSSRRARQSLLTYYNDILQHIKARVLDSGRYGAERRRIEFAPNINLVSEMELNSDWNMTGYAGPEIAGFRQYLQSTYASIRELNGIWGSSFDSFDQINPTYSSYNWHEANLAYKQYTYSPGRQDWLAYKTGRLKSIIDEFAQATTSAGFHMGVQLGSLHDFRLDFRGFYDPTAFLEYADAFRLADIRDYQSVFAFGADYARSVGNYWTWRDGRPRGFSSETNDHLFGYSSGSQESYSRDLALAWVDQVQTYYELGADCHIVFGWGNTQNKSSKLVQDPAIQQWYQPFRNKLKTLARKPIRKLDNRKALHLSANSFAYKSGLGDKFYFHRKMVQKSHDSAMMNTYQNRGFDLVTDYMISCSPQYLDHYEKFYLSETSEYMPATAYENLLRKRVIPSMLIR